MMLEHVVEAPPHKAWVLREAEGDPEDVEKLAKRRVVVMGHGGQ